MRSFISLILCAALAACSSKIYDDAPTKGRFSGSLFVLWVDAGSDGEGAGKFVYVPDLIDENGLKFTRSANADGTFPDVRTITPHVMYTDGGSIPRAAQPFKGFSPWGYAPAYMVHDWLFVANRCLEDEKRGLAKAFDQERQIEGMEFRESYEIMAEMLHALQKSEQVMSQDIAPAAISWAVSSGESKRRWNARGECEKTDRVSPEHLAQIEQRLGFDPITGAPAVQAFGDKTVPARLVTTLTFE